MTGLHKTIERLTRISAYLGGATLTIIIVMTCVSISGRVLNGFLNGAFMQSAFPGLAAGLLEAGVGPVRGDYEFTEAGMAFAVFAFLPLCQMHAAHAAVDVFAEKIGARFGQFMLWVAEVIFAGAMLLIAWQLLGGLGEKLTSRETTFHLEYPVWWGYAFAMLGSALSALVAVYLAILRSREYLFGIPMPAMHHSAGDGA